MGKLEHGHRPLHRAIEGETRVLSARDLVDVRVEAFDLARQMASPSDRVHEVSEKALEIERFLFGAMLTPADPPPEPDQTDPGVSILFPGLKRTKGIFDAR